MRKGNVLDAVKIVFQVDSAAAGVYFLLKLLLALVPALQTLAVAAFIDQVTAAGTAGARNDGGLLFLIFVLVTLVAFSWISKSIAGLLEQHMEMQLRAVFKPRLVEKISRLKYEAMEAGGVRDKISRVNRNAEGRVREAYRGLLRLLELILKAAGVLIILFTLVWWLALVILAVSIPCFCISMKSGKEDYDAQADVTKVNRLNEYYHEMLKGREYVDERTLFGYHREYRERFLQQYEEARKYTTGIRLKWFIKMKAGSMAVIVVSAAALTVMIPLTLNGALSTGMFMALMNAIFGIVQNMSWDLTYSIDRVAWYQNWFRELSDVFSMSEDQTLADGKENAELEGKRMGYHHLHGGPGRRRCGAVRGGPHGRCQPAAADLVHYAAVDPQYHRGYADSAAGQGDGNRFRPAAADAELHEPQRGGSDRYIRIQHGYEKRTAELCDGSRPV